jgi:solute carrier family 25 S-adenosylmethionine transporter 26
MLLVDALAFKSINDPIKNQINSCAAICVKQDDPCHFLRVLYESLITGGLAGVVVEAALYPIDTIKTRIQVARDGGKIIWKGLYSGLGGNLVGVLPASALFFGVYEPTKQKLLKVLPDNLSAVAHLVCIILKLS